jgi:hypothetical protein
MGHLSHKNPLYELPWNCFWLPSGIWAACQFMLANSITNELQANCSEEHKPVHVCHVQSIYSLLRTV